jgi:aldose 1-epimerase
MATTAHIGGLPVVRLTAPAAAGTPAITTADIAPGRGMLLLQARATLAPGAEVDLIEAPDLAEAAARLADGLDDFAGNQSFAFGGAVLIPFANRIRGRAVTDAREILTSIDERSIRLPRNWGGRAPGAEQYAMHGLILATAVTDFEQIDDATLVGHLAAGDFAGRWPSRTDLEFRWRLVGGGLELRVIATNSGAEVLPMGIGWHPYLRIPSGRREQARLIVPASTRLETDNPDQVLPTGRCITTAATAYDFASQGGRALADLALDDCFVDLTPDADGVIEMGFDDPASGLAVRLETPTAQVKAVQVFAPSDRAFVVLEPQFNWPDPAGDCWPSTADTGLQRLAPGAGVAYQAHLKVRTIAAAGA